MRHINKMRSCSIFPILLCFFLLAFLSITVAWRAIYSLYFRYIFTLSLRRSGFAGEDGLNDYLGFRHWLHTKFLE